jgi:hypothetical protein
MISAAGPRVVHHGVLGVSGFQMNHGYNGIFMGYSWDIHVI